MSHTIEHIALYLRQDVRALSVVSDNIANASTVGYRAKRLGADFMSLAGPASVLPQLNAGPMTETGGAFDFALEGDGYFALGDAQGLLLTRAGQFQRNADGHLADASGRVVLGQGGAIALGPEPITVGANGDVQQNGKILDRLLILQPADAAALRAEVGGLRPTTSAVEADASVRQGFLEGANVDAAHETIALIELTRHVESVQRALSIYDKALELGINRLGE